MSDAEIPAEGPAHAPEEEISPGGFVAPPVEELNALFDQFEVLELISVGGMGAVYKAWQPKLERHVALKVLPPDSGGDLGFDERFAAEARTLAKLKHTNIVSVHDFGEVGPYHYFAMEFVDGRTLFEILHENPLIQERALSIFYQICDALGYAHDNGIIHRDIKSANILVGNDGIVKVVDFGLAKIRKAPGVIREKAEPGALMGTPDYAAPELLKPGAHVDHRADVFALGVLLYECLTGRTIGSDWVPPSKLAGSDPPIDSVILKAVSPDLDKRYQSVAQFRASLDQVLKMRGKKGGPTTPKPSGPLRAGKRGKRKMVAAPAKGGATKPAPPPPAAAFLSKKSSSPFGWAIAVVAIVGLVIAYLVMRDDSGNAKKPPVEVEEDPLTATNLPDEPIRRPGDSDGGSKPKPIKPRIAVPKPKPKPPKPDPKPGVKEVEKLREAFDRRMAEDVDRAHVASLGALDERYLEAVATAAAEAGGDSQDALLDEALRVKEKRPLPESDDPGLDPAVLNLRKIYRAEQAKAEQARNVKAYQLAEGFMEQFGDLGIRLLGQDDEEGAQAAAAARRDLSAKMEKWKSSASPQAFISSPTNPTPGRPDPPDPTPVAPDPPANAATVEVFTASPGSTVDMGLGGKGIGILAGIRGKFSSSSDHVDLSIPSLSGKWELTAKDQSESKSVRGYGIYYESPRVDFSEARFSIYTWDPTSEIKRHVRTDRGFAMFAGLEGHWGSTQSFEIYEGRNRYWQTRGQPGRYKNPRAYVVIVEFPSTRMPQLDKTEYAWATGQEPVKMIHKDAGFCVLTMIHGPFRGGGEHIHLEIGEDGFWYLGKQSLQSASAAKAVAFSFDD